MADTIEYEVEGTTAYLRFDRPEKGNAISWKMWKEVSEAIYDADEDGRVRSIIVTGNGDAFCAGGDLEKFLPKMISNEVDIWPKQPQEDMMLRNSTVTTPIIAAVNGPCLAGGLEFLQATDIRVAETDAQIGVPEVTHGLVPAGGTHTRLPRQIPYAFAAELILTGDPVTAAEAQRMGIVNKVVENGNAVSAAEEYADSIADNGPNAVQTAKEIITRGLRVPLEQSFHLEETLARDVIWSDEAREGITAFKEKRKPAFDEE